MKKMWLLFILATFCFANAANAYQTENELERVGFYWLSPQFTTDLSYEEIITEISTPDSPFFGYQIASLAQVNSLMSFYGFDLDAADTGASVRDDSSGNVAQLFIDFGYTFVHPRYNNLSGFILENVDDDTTYYARVYVSHGDDVVWKYGYQGWWDLDMNASYSSIGTWLVRETASVPVPGTILLLGSGLIGLIGLRKNRL